MHHEEVADQRSAQFPGISELYYSSPGSTSMCEALKYALLAKSSPASLALMCQAGYLLNVKGWTSDMPVELIMKHPSQNVHTEGHSLPPYLQ